MPAVVMDGKQCALQGRQRLQALIREQRHQGRPAPGLAVVLLGQDPASTIYVTNKRRACEEVGIRSFAYDLPEQTTEAELLSLIDTLNDSPEIQGILIQLPLAPHIEEAKVIERIRPEKDVDGFHPYNMGRLAQGNPFLRPCTPMGIMQLLDYYTISVQKKQALVIGASNIVGRPMSLELLKAGATVTVSHSLTENLDELIPQADVIVVAVGKMDVVDCRLLQSKQVLIDVGIHRLPNGQIRGDLDFEKARHKVAYLTPVPGGVGPMTITALLENTWLAYSTQLGITYL